MRRPKMIAIDTETTGLSAWHGDRPFALSTCDEEGNQLYFEWTVDPHTRQPDYGQCSGDFDIVREWCADRRVTKIFFNAKFDFRMMEHAGLLTEFNGRLEEVMFAAHACNSDEVSFKLKKLSEKYLNIRTDDETDLQRATNAARYAARKWNEHFLESRIGLKAYRESGGDFSEFPDSWKLADEVPADYWMVAEAVRRLPLSYRGKLKSTDAFLCQRYCMKDTERTMLLWMMYDREMDRFGVRSTYDMEMQLWPITKQMEDRGVRVDCHEARVQRKAYLKRMRRFEHECYRIAGECINLNSPKQLVEIIYGRMKEKPWIFTRTGQPAVDIDVLETLRETNPFVSALAVYRSAEKAVGTFYGKYLQLALPDPLNPGGHCIHADFNQVGPRTGRYSCRTPNLQQVADPTTGRSILPMAARKPFGPRPGYVWYMYDYSQLEVRIFAALAKEEFMIEALTHNRDLHGEVANRAWGGADNPAAIEAAIHALEFRMDVPTSKEVEELWNKSRSRMRESHISDQISTQLTRAQEIERDKIFHDIAYEWIRSFDYDIVKAEASLYKKVHRNRAKLVLFCRLFGGGIAKVGKITKSTEEEAKKFVADYDRAFPRIKEFIRETSEYAMEYGYVKDAYGRILRVDPDRPYIGTNYRIQGSAASLMKRAMIRVDEYLRSTGLDIHIVMTIHDEITVEVRREHAFLSVLKRIKEIMEDHNSPLRIDMPVDCEKTYTAWDRKRKIKI